MDPGSPYEALGESGTRYKRGNSPAISDRPWSETPDGNGGVVTVQSTSSDYSERSARKAARARWEEEAGMTA
jgi:hypothetical protein